MRVQLLGKRWLLKFVPTLSEDKLADCDAPSTTGKKIRVRSTLRGEKRLATLIHEMLHAVNWHFDEEFVQEASTDIAHVLWQLGYRQKKKKELDPAE